MQVPSPQNNTTKLFREDIIRLNSNGELWIVMRSWNDLDEMPLPDYLNQDPSARPLVAGEVVLVNLEKTTRTIAQENACSLIERYFHIGDTVKRFPLRSEDVMSGVVTDRKSELLLRHIISEEPLPGNEWVPESDLEMANDINVGDFVIHGNWLGNVEEIFEEVEGEINGHPMCLHDVSARFRLGKPSDYSKAGLADGQAPDIVVAINPLVLCISWSSLNQSLSAEEAAKCDRPPRFFKGHEINTLTLLKRSADRIPHVSDRVRFRTDALSQRYRAPTTTHSRGQTSLPSIQVNAMMVVSTRTQVTVLWQDGTTEELPSMNLVQYHTLDEVDCWPGDFVHWNGDGETRLAIVQKLNPRERTATIRWAPPKSDEEPASVVSCLELDPRGKDNEGFHVFGVQRGDIVFLHPPGKTNGSTPPLVPKIGELEAWVHEPDSQQWRDTFVEMGVQLSRIPYEYRGQIFGYAASVQATSVRWVGEVTGLLSNGDVEVQLADGTHEVVSIDRLTILNDFVDDLAMEAEELDDEDEDEEMPAVGSTLEQVSNAWQDFFFPGRSSQPFVDEIQPDAWGHLDDEPIGDTVTSEAVDIEVDSLSPSSPQSASTPVTPSIEEPSLPTHVAPSDPSEASSPLWTSFSILPTAPPDHAFLSVTPPSQPSRTFMTRVNKEYRVLSSSLPADVVVRAYEDRSDLLRCLIIGSENTPYTDAPFVIDWMLPANFPNEPPKAHFHSWTNGNGRVNPNLYEDGKVCLSILGTWEGDQSESWNAKRSSLLQAFVSIQGLVLVREPYYCEPSYEKMRGTEEGKLSSRLYSERAYVAARGFVRHALESPPAGLADELRSLYFNHGKLKKVIDDADELITTSRRPAEESTIEPGDCAVPRLTVGAILPLERTLARLRTILCGTPSQ
ncbi:hypothetical protein DL93DRAFT_2147193 [Clavulina sp. PMI_390]|nr:hypothetical protein DL93DRAFT_2147193 [Clavulina sp. PMI_390]